MRGLTIVLNRKGLSALGLLAALTLHCCGPEPRDESDAIHMDFNAVDAPGVPAKGPVQVDILWVMDHSASMCQETTALSRAFADFAQKTTAEGALDIRTAVVSMSSAEGQGVFVHTPALNYPPSCFEHEVYPCLEHSDCAMKFGEGWECGGYDAGQMYNLNGSVNGQCIFRCDDDSECCEEFFDTATSGEYCPYECQQTWQGSGNSGCLRAPDTKDCPTDLPAVLTNANLDLLRCLVAAEPEQSYQANIEQGFKTAWAALNPDGPFPEQATGFLRPEALLLVVFVSDEDDCSIDPHSCSPNYTCDTDKDCPMGAQCKTDWYYSQKKEKKIKLCCGTIKKDYYNVCSLLGEYKGAQHHACAMDLDCQDCEEDDDCEYGWHCKQGKKCRPGFYSLTNIASYQSPPGTPLFSLSPVSEFYQNLKSLKSDPANVFVAAITGDAILHSSDAASLISQECLDNPLLTRCAAYVAAHQGLPPGCVGQPEHSGCEAFVEARLECAQECYLASKGNPKSPTVAKNTYICNSELGKADYGSRYARLTKMFGPNGLAANVCSPDAMPSALDAIADRLLELSAR